MAVNPDPKPGRWILPLVVLGMVAFTYFFVRALPSTDGLPIESTQPGSGSSVPGTGSTTPGTAETTTPGTFTDPAAQAYLEGVSGILTSLEDLQREMSAVNGGFDADPRTVEYSEAVDRLTALSNQASALVDQIDALTPPESLATNHETIRNAITSAATAAEDALAGLQSNDDGSQRRNAVEAFDTAVSDLQTAVANARAAAGLSTPTTSDTTPTTTGDTTGDTTGNG